MSFLFLNRLKSKNCSVSLLFLLVLMTMSFTGAHALNTNVEVKNRQSGSDSRGYAHFMMGQIFDRQKEHYKAIAEYQEALKYKQGAVWIYLKMAQNYIDLNEMELAQESIAKALEAGLQSTEAHSLLAYIYTSTKEYDLAAAEYKKILEIDPTDKLALSSLADLLVFQGKNQDAIEAYEELIGQIDDLPILHFNLGLIFLRIQDLDRAAFQFGRVLELDNEFAPAYLSLALISEIQEDAGKAIYYYEEALKRAPLDINIHNQLGRLYVEKKDYEKAITHYKLILEFYPEDTASYITLAYLYADNEEPDKSVAILKSGLEENVAAADRLYLALAHMYQRLQQDDLAEETYKIAQKVNPEDDLAYFYLGAFYEKDGKRNKSVLQLKKAIELNPDNAHALNYLGYMYAEDGINLDEAKEMINRALEIEPDNGAYVDSLGWVYYKLGELQKAKELLERAAQLVEDAVVFDHLGDIYYKTGQADKARENWQKSLKLDPTIEGVEEKIERLKK